MRLLPWLPHLALGSEYRRAVHGNWDVRWDVTRPEHPGQRMTARVSVSHVGRAETLMNTGDSRRSGQRVSLCVFTSVRTVTHEVAGSSPVGPAIAPT